MLFTEHYWGWNRQRLSVLWTWRAAVCILGPGVQADLPALCPQSSHHTLESLSLPTDGLCFPRNSHFHLEKKRGSARCKTAGLWKTHIHHPILGAKVNGCIFNSRRIKKWSPCFLHRYFFQVILVNQCLPPQVFEDYLNVNMGEFQCLHL